MSVLQNFTNRTLTYYPAELSQGKEWFIRYYIFNPFTNKMERKRIKLNRIKSITERKRIARELIIDINKKLASGWNPYLDSDTTKIFTKLSDVLKTFENAKEKELCDSSMRSYRSFLNHLKSWLQIRNINMYCGEFNSIIASDFMLHIKSMDKISNRTYNNALSFYRILFNWMIEYQFITVNPFTSIKKIPARLIQKKRKYFDREELKRLVSFLEVENKYYLAASMLVYYCLIRPDDLAELKISSFDFNKKLLFIRMEETKNKHDSYRVIPKALEKYLSAIEWGSLRPNDYIFSDRKLFKHGNKKLDSREFSRYWNDVIRPNCDFGMDKQFYGLKDTGITNLMADGISPGYVQGQADHSSLDVTNKYNHTRTPEGYQQLRDLAKEI